MVRIDDPVPGATTVQCVGDAEVLKKAARLEETTAFLRDAMPADDWIARKDLVKEAKEAGIAAKTLDETLRTLEKDGQVDREDRKSEKGRGRKPAYYRWKADPNLFHVSTPI